VTEVYEVGHRRVGVRWTQGGLDAELRALADAALGMQDAPANISIVLGQSTGRSRSKHQLHVQGHLLTMVDGDGGLVRAVIRALSALAGDPPPGSLRLNASLVIDDDNAAVAVDWRLTADLQQLGPLLRRRGRRVLHLPRLHVLPDRGSAWLADPAAVVGLTRENLDARWPLEPGDDDLAAGDVAITRLVYAGPPELVSRPERVAALVPTVRDATDRVTRGDVAHLARLTAGLPVDGVVMGDRTRLVGLLGL
jgi:hypothetical protein